MRIGLAISMLFVLLTSGAQQKQLLKKQDFANLSLDTQWVYVRLADDQAKAELKGRRHTSLSSEGPSQLIKVQVPSGKDPVAFCNELRKSKNLIYADPIVAYQPLSGVSDPLAANQYYLENIRAYEAWEITTGDDDITIGIIDTGLDLDHEDISNNLWINSDDPIDGIDNDENGYVDDYMGYDFADRDTDPNIDLGNHGMIVGGIAGASVDNGKGIAGVGYNTKVAALKGFKSSNGSSFGLYEAILYAAENEFDVINLSWGRMGIPLQSEQDIINYAVLEKNVVVVAAAGNEGGRPTEENKWYPASYEHVLSVGASNQSDNKSPGSTFNHSVDLIAPGVSIYSTTDNNDYISSGPGTSFASPQVAAAAALVIDQFPELNALQVMEQVRASSDDVYDIGTNATYDGKLGKGRLNVLRAVSNPNIRSVRAQGASLTSQFGDNVFFGDTVQVSATIINYLSPVNDVEITISSPDEIFSISQGMFAPGYLGTMDAQEISFEVVLDEDVAPETTIGIRLDYSGTGYSDFQFIDVTTSPEYVDFGNDVLRMTISGDGDLGFNEYGINPEGSGFRYLLDTLMTYTGLILATSESEVSDNVIINYSSEGRSQNFNVQRNYKLATHPGADHFGYSEFTDNARPLIIEQSNITWENEDFLIVRYRLVNNSETAITNLSLGIFADWDLKDKTTNYAAYDEDGDYTFVRSGSSDLFAGVQVLGGDRSSYSALDIGSFNGNMNDVGTTFDDASKYDFLVNRNITVAGTAGAGNDVATISGVTVNQLDAFGEAFVNVVYAVASDQDALADAFDQAKSQLSTFLQKPRVLETRTTCDGFEVSLDPANGELFQFYRDPLALQPIGSEPVSSLMVTTSQDTSFYVKNVDQTYPSDVFEIRLKLLNEIADFSLSTDTLYLDSEITNVVSFEDKSLDAVSWNWDFGQGTTASIQHPSLSFTEAGTYTISLAIQNTQGCTDQVSKQLVVANRPTAPSLSPITICPGEPFELNDPTADKLNVYTLMDQLNPVASAFTPTLSGIFQDTTLYVSGIYNSFESARIPVSVDVMEISGNIRFHPDTTTINDQMVVLAENVSESSVFNWNIDGQGMGSEANVSFAISTGAYQVELEITNENGCKKTIKDVVEVSTSPFATQQDLVSCLGEAVTLQPANGTIFGFYEDAELTTLIKKGTKLTTSEFSKVYVVSLDDGLPGMPIEVNISKEEVPLTIAYTQQKLGDKNEVRLSAEADAVNISNYQWFLNGSLFETLPTPTIFLDDEPNEIQLLIQTIAGCTAADTLNLDFTPPLSVDTKRKLFTYPNPTKGSLHLQHVEQIKQLRIISSDGKMIFNERPTTANMDVSFLSQGVYLVQVETANSLVSQQLVIQ